jgi:ribose transport system ATP-binding protein
VLLEWPMWMNMTISSLGDFKRFGRMSQRAEQAVSESLVARFDVQPPRIDLAMRMYSGGNQQKGLLARWLRRPDLSVLVVDEGTQGIDAKSRKTIYNHVRDFAVDGGTVVWCSTDVEECVHLSDRLLIVNEGRVIECLEGSRLTSEAVLISLYGKSFVKAEERGR